MKVDIDDIWYYITTTCGKRVDILHQYEMSDCLDILLTDNQRGKLYSDVTVDFTVTETRFNKMLDFINDDENNVWRRQHSRKTNK